MKSKLKTLSGVVFKDGPIYMKIQMNLKEWKKVYEKRKMKGDDAVIKFINHLAELKEVTTKE